MATSKTHSSMMFFLILTLFLSSNDSSDVVQKSLSDLLNHAKKNGGIIHGNPLLYEECANALLTQHQSNADWLKTNALPTPWFWSRESLDAVIKNMPLARRTKITHTNQELNLLIPFQNKISYNYMSNIKPHRLVSNGIKRWYDSLGESIYNDVFNVIYPKHNDGYNVHSNENENDNICFYHIEKSGSSSISGMLLEYNNTNRSYTSENVLLHCECGFTFLRDPISRFVSGYYTINKLIYWYHHHLPRIGKKGPKFNHVPNKFSFWNITGEPQRMIEFINNMNDNAYEFTKTTPLEHLMTQTGLLSVSRVDLHYIGKVKHLMDDLDIIKNKCAKRTNNNDILNNDLVEQQIMTHFGTKWMDELKPWYTDMLDLNDYQPGDLEPAYLALADSYDLYQKVVQYYKQDYICFGFQHNWNLFRNKIYTKYNETLKRKKERNKQKSDVL